MNSKAAIKGHPIHPALVAFPVAFLAGAVIFDIAGRVLDRPAMWTTGGYLALAGIGTALLAAVPGFIDYLYTVPPRSSAKARATKHMVVNLTAVGLYAAAALVRDGVATRPGNVVIALMATGFLLMCVGGWLGGELVAKNMIGVANRYADRARWSEISVDGEAGKSVAVALADELKVDQMKLVRTGDRRIVVARLKDGYAAFDDRCPHTGGSLAGGVLLCGTVQCPWHGSRFDVKTGALEGGPATVAIKCYEVKETSGEIRLTL